MNLQVDINMSSMYLHTLFTQIQWCREAQMVENSTRPKRQELN